MTMDAIRPYALPTPEELPENRVRWPSEPARTALLIHDMQTYFAAAFRADVPPLPPVVENIARLREVCRRLGIPVIYSAQPHRQSARDRGLLNDMWGPGPQQPEDERILEALAPEEGDLVLTKWRYSAFVRTDLAARLAELGRDQLWICGIYGHIGCLMTACDAFMRDLRVTLVADGIADFSRRDHLHALEFVAGRCGQVSTTQDLVDRLTLVPKVLADLAEVLSPGGALDPDAALLDLGLDSMRLMTLAERWRAEGFAASFLDLATCTTARELTTALLEGGRLAS